MNREWKGGCDEEGSVIAWVVLASVALILSSASAESAARGKCVARVFSKKASYVFRVPGQDMFVVAGVHE